MSIAYFMVSLYLSMPYRYFPGDEVKFLEQVEDKYEVTIISLDNLKKKKMPPDVIEKLSSRKGTIYKYDDYRATLVGVLGQNDYNQYGKTIFRYTKRPFLLSGILKTYQPVFYLGLHIHKIIWGYFSDDYNSTLAFSSVFCTSITLIFIALIVFMITSNRYLCYLSFILYGTSTWPLSYFYFYSYVVFATMFASASTYFLILAYLKKKDQYIIAAGVLAALLFLSSTSALPFIAVQIIALYLLFYADSGAMKKVFLFTATAYIVISPLFSMFYYEFETHLMQNITANWYILSTNLPFENVIPQLIFILWIYNKVLATYFFVLAAIFVYVYLSNRLVKKVTKSETDVRKKVLFILMIMLIVYLVLIENTGYFSVARVYLIIYPFFIITFCSLLNNVGFLTDIFIKRYWKYSDKVIWILHIAVIILIIINSISDDKDLLKVRREAPQFLQSLIDRHYKVYYISEDPHVPSIKAWLVSKIHRQFEFETVSKNNLKDIINGKKSNEKIAFIIKGPDSLIKECEPILNKGQIFKLNYYGGYFAFLLENDIPRDLLASGKMAKNNHSLDIHKIKVVLFE